MSSSGVKVVLTDEGVIRSLYGRELYDPIKHRRVDLGLIPFENIVNKVEPFKLINLSQKNQNHQRGNLPLQNCSETKPKKNTLKKPLCNKRNPPPPCPEGMIIKSRPNGEECCLNQ